jgi:hypothetical protein
VEVFDNASDRKRTATGSPRVQYQAVGLREKMDFVYYAPAADSIVDSVSAVLAHKLQDQLLRQHDKQAPLGPPLLTLHRDSTYSRGSDAGYDRRGERSFVTLQLFLNDDFDGGEVTFSQGEPRNGKGNDNDKDFCHALEGNRACAATVRPRAGSVLLYQHDCLHSAAQPRVPSSETCTNTHTSSGSTSSRTGGKYVMKTVVMYSTHGPEAEYAHRPFLARHFDNLY